MNRFSKGGKIIIFFICMILIQIFLPHKQQAFAQIYDADEYGKVFQAAYYYENNPDVAQAFGYNEEQLLKHFVDFGMSEGRQACDQFNVYAYKAYNADLSEKFGQDYRRYYEHYMQYGFDEQRIANSDTYYKDVDYALVYDKDFYQEQYSDVAAAFDGNAQLMLKHFVTNGMEELRRASKNFDVYAYKMYNSDLSEAFGEDYIKYYEHYIQYGHAENRKCTSDTMYEGVDYRAVYNRDYYYQHYPDLQSAFGNDMYELLKHFVDYGMSEGRQACTTFNVKVYQAANKDVEDCFGTDSRAYYQHYLQYGRMENRISIPVSEKWVVTQYSGKTESQGMFYTLVSGNGELIVVDGGVCGNADYVREVINNFGGHVSAWILTHPHPDHIGAFNEIYQNPKGIVIDRIYDDPVNYDVYDKYDNYWDEIDVYTEYLMLTGGDTRIHSLHEGDVLSVMGLELQVFHAYDDLITLYSTDICNDGGLMFRVSSTAMSMLFCADISYHMEDIILKKYGDQLASDYVQMGHHGNSTLSYGFYDLINAKGAFFDAPEWLVRGSQYTTQKYLQYMKSKGTAVYLWENAPNSVE